MPTAPRLLGNYTAPLVEIGQVVQCALRGEVEVVKLSAGPNQWPMGRYPPNGNVRFLIVMGDLVEAVRRESAEAIRYWWRVLGYEQRMSSAKNEAWPRPVLFSLPASSIKGWGGPCSR
jgi:hypothetical protein